MGGWEGGRGGWEGRCSVQCADALQYFVPLSLSHNVSGAQFSLPDVQDIA